MDTRIRNYVVRILLGILLLSFPFIVATAQETLPPDSGLSSDTRQVFVLQEDDELIGVSWTGRFDKLDLRASEEIITGVAKKAIAVYITGDRYLGYSGLRNRWYSTNRKVAERFIDLQAGDANAVVLTTKRILSFNGRNWTARRRD